MSMQTNIVKGKGFYVYVSEDILCEFFKAHKETVLQQEGGKEVIDWIESKGKAEDSIKEKFFDYECAVTGFGGIYGLVADVMSAETLLPFEYYVTEDAEFDDVILMRSWYPWEMSQEMKDLTWDKFNEIVTGYIKELGGQLEIEEIRLEYLT